MDSNDVRRQWAERTGEYSPEYYAYYGPNETSELIRSLVAEFVDRDAAILELGCSAGRHLAHLRENGFESLSGVDVNADAGDVMAEHYPGLATDGTFYFDAIEAVVGEFDDDAFDAVYSVETLQHLHPDSEWVFDEIARITDDVLVTVENEGGGDSSGTDDDQSAAGSTADAERESDRERSVDRGVNYVHDEFPLYYRDWNAVFTELGFTEVDVRSTDRDRVRVFRTTDG